jgi:uncharacterized protein (TIGR03000 family)
MYKHLLTGIGATAVFAAALLLMPSATFAQHHGGHGGHGGGGGGAHYSHAAPARAYGGSARYGSAYRGGYNGGGWNGYYGRHGDWDHHYGWGRYPWWGWGLGLGWGYPGYYGSYYPDYNYGYSYAPSYYYDSTPYYDYSAPTYDYGTYNSTPTPTTPAPADQAPEPLTENTVHLDIRVPDPNARVWVEGATTTLMGTDRQFESPPLNPGREYIYNVKAEWMQDGLMTSQARQVRVYAGDNVVVDFTQPAAQRVGG